MLVSRHDHIPNFLGIYFYISPLTSQNKGTVYARTGREGPQGKLYSSTLSLTSALNGDGWAQIKLLYFCFRPIYSNHQRKPEADVYHSKFHTDDRKIPGTTVQKPVVQATWCPGFRYDCTHVSLFCNTVPDHTGAFVPSWHACNHSVAAETRLLHRQPFTDSFGRQLRRGGQIANCKSSVSQNRFLHTCCVLRHWCAEPNSAAVTVDVPSTIFELESAILWHVVPSLHHHHTPRTTGGDLRGGARFVPLRTETHYERRGTDFPMSLPLHINLSPHQHVTDRLLCQLLQIVPITTIKCFINTQVTGLRALLTEHPVSCVDRSVRIQLAATFLNQDLSDNTEILTTSGW